MKIITFLTLMLYAITINAQVQPSDSPKLSNVLIIAWCAGLPTLCAIDYINTNYPYYNDNNGLYISGGLDPKMMINYNTSDIITKIGYKYNKHNGYISNELFEAIQYKAYGVGYDYAVVNKKVSVLTGLEYSLIYRPWKHGKAINSIGFNTNINLNITKHIAIGCTINFKTRNDTTKKIINNEYFNVILTL